MMSKFVICTLLISLAFAYGRNVPKPQNSRETYLENECRNMGTPFIGGIFLLGCRTTDEILSNVWSLIPLKLGAVSFISSVTSNVVDWVLENLVLTILIVIGLSGLYLMISNGLAKNTGYDVEQLNRVVSSDCGSRSSVYDRFWGI